MPDKDKAPQFVHLYLPIWETPDMGDCVICHENEYSAWQPCAGIAWDKEQQCQ